MYPASVVMRSASRAVGKAGDGDSPGLPPSPGLPDSIMRKQLIDAQQSDTSLQPLYARLVKDSDTVHGYVVSVSGLPGVYDWQVVVPSSLQNPQNPGTLRVKVSWNVSIKRTSRC